MNSMTNWGFSSSSESDSDEDRPVSKLRTDTLFYQHYQRGIDYGEDWPLELRGSSHQNHHRLANSSILMDANGHANTSFANLSRIGDLDDNRILSPASILPPDDIVLINDNGKFRPIRVISKTEILPPRKSKTPDSKLKQKRFKVEPSDDERHEPREIPLEMIDLVDFPRDPRKPKPDHEQFYDDADEDSGLVLPRFWRETVLKSAMNKNHSPHVNGKFRMSNSLILKKSLEKTKRLGMVPARRDPRLDRSLFVNPPRKVTSPPKKKHNRSHPNIASSGSIFDDAENVSSNESAFSSNSESFGSLPSAGDDHFNAHNSTKVDDNKNGHNDLDSVSGSDDDNDCSFTAFQKRKMSSKTKRVAKRTKHLESTSTNEDEKVPPIRIDLKKKKVTPPNEKKKKKLFNLPTIMDKEAILSALEADTANEDQENVSVNPRKKGTRTSARTAKKNANKIKLAPISGPNLKISNGVCDISLDSSTSAQQHSKAYVVKEIETVMPVVEQIDLSVETKVNVQDANEIEMTNTEVAVVKTQLSGQSIEMLSEKSTSSIGSIEQRLSEMISPVKTAAEVRAEQNDEILTDILTDGNNGVSSITTNTDDDNHLYDTTAAAVEPEMMMIVADLMTVATEDSGIQTASDSPPFESNSDSSVVIQSDSNDKTDQDIPCDTPESALQPQLPSPSQQTNAEGIESQNATIDASVPNNTVPLIQIPIPEQPDLAVVSPAASGSNVSAEIDILAANLSFGSSDIGANTEISIAEYAKNFLDSNEIDVGPLIASNSPAKDGAKQSKKAHRSKIIITDFSENGNVAALKLMTSDDAEISDDDYENDTPCGIDALTLPNSNTDRNANDDMKSSCNLCSYQATKGWKQLTKHYVRKHPGKEISISRLARQFNPQELQITTFSPMISKGLAGIMIQSLCYICNEGYKMCSSKWLMHFIAHTGEFEFRCNKCRKEIMQDLHKECNSKGNERINGPYDFIDNVLYGYVCGLCSYVQLSKSNVIMHLENEHQLIIGNDNENVIEIILLKSTLEDLGVDNKNDEELVQAKERMSTIHQPNRYQNFSPVIISDGDDDDSEEECPKIQTFDLTLSDEEM